MVFSTTSRRIHLKNSVLHAVCRRSNGKSWTYSSIDLNDYIGNKDGSFQFGQKHFYASARSVQLKENILCAELLKHDTITTSIVVADLDLFIENIDGKLRYKKLHESILLSCSSFSLTGSVLKALCIASDGKQHLSRIDLNKHYANIRGSFKSGYGRFFHSCRNTKLVVSSKSIILKSELKYKGRYQPAEIDLAICVVNDNGELKFVKHDGLADRDGFFANSLESVPVVGFIIAAIHALAGNKDHALRALALCSNSTIVTSSIMIGSLLGGPIGEVLGAGIATRMAIIAETQFSGAIEDPRINARFKEATSRRYILETLSNMLLVVFGAGVGDMLGAILAKVLKEATSVICQPLGQVLVKAVAAALTALLKKSSDVLKSEWEVLLAKMSH